MSRHGVNQDLIQQCDADVKPSLAELVYDDRVVEAELRMHLQAQHMRSPIALMLTNMLWLACVHRAFRQALGDPCAEMWTGCDCRS